MKKKIAENWEKIVPDWNTTSPGGNYQIWKLKNWKKMGLIATLKGIDEGIVSLKNREDYCLKKGIKFIKY